MVTPGQPASANLRISVMERSRPPPQGPWRRFAPRRRRRARQPRRSGPREARLSGFGRAVVLPPQAGVSNLSDFSDVDGLPFAAIPSVASYQPCFQTRL